MTFDPATNHQTGVNYDGNGNPMEGKIYDVENRIISEPGYQQYTYDYRGKRNTKLMGSTTELYFYGIDGKKLATYQCAAGTQQNGYQFTCSSPAFDTYWKGKLVKSKGQEVTTDRLGSVRWARDDGWRAYYPYGEERWASNDNREKFGTYVRDNSTQDYADQRYYGPGTGRFFTADPGARRAANLGKPMSWNSYFYGLGNPIGLNDPHGLNASICDFWDCEELGCDDDDEECELEGGGGGGGGEEFGAEEQGTLVNGTLIFSVSHTGCSGAELPDGTCLALPTPSATAGMLAPRQSLPDSFFILPRGMVRVIRLFDKNGNASVDIDYQANHPDVGDPHIHIWKDGTRGTDKVLPPFSKIPPRPTVPPGASGPYSPWPRQPMPRIGWQPTQTPTVTPAPVPPGSGVFLVIDPCVIPGIRRILPATCSRGAMN